MPPTLGQRLKHAREKRGLSLRDLEHSTRIPMARLQDLEDDNLNGFGGMAYAKSFLKSYASLLEVDADEVLSRMKPPPLGGVRDYRYLVESQGRWVTERRPHEAPLAPASGLNAGRSFLFAAMVSVACAVLIGGGLIARAYFSSSPDAGHSAQGGTDSTASSTAATTRTPTADSGGLTGGAYVSPDQVKEQQEFTVSGVSVNVAPQDSVVLKAIPVPPKAQPVLEPPGRHPASPPKAEPVRGN